MNGVAHTVVGVLPANFYFQGANYNRAKDVFIPVGQFTDPFFQVATCTKGRVRLAV